MNKDFIFDWLLMRLTRFLQFLLITPMFWLSDEEYEEKQLVIFRNVFAKHCMWLKKVSAEDILGDILGNEED